MTRKFRFLILIKDRRPLSQDKPTEELVFIVTDDDNAALSDTDNTDKKFFFGDLIFGG